jgi:hypothetical protein
MIEFNCAGKKKYSQSKSNVSATSSVYWGEHIFFEFSNMVLIAFIIYNYEIDKK